MEKSIKIHQGFWTRDEVARDTESVYVFGDNFQDSANCYVPTSTQAVIRCLPNSLGIPTKHDRYWSEYSFIGVDDFLMFQRMLEIRIEQIKQHLEQGKTIVFPSDGIGTGKARLLKKAPMCWKYLCRRLKEEFDYDNGQDN